MKVKRRRSLIKRPGNSTPLTGLTGAAFWSVRNSYNDDSAESLRSDRSRSELPLVQVLAPGDHVGSGDEPQLNGRLGSRRMS